MSRLRRRTLQPCLPKPEVKGAVRVSKLSRVVGGARARARACGALATQTWAKMLKSGILCTVPARMCDQTWSCKMGVILPSSSSSTMLVFRYLTQQLKCVCVCEGWGLIDRPQGPHVMRVHAALQSFKELLELLLQTPWQTMKSAEVDDLL